MALAFQGRFEEAIAEGKRAIELDPLSPPAKALARKAAELDPTYFFAVMVDGWTDLEVGKFREAIPALKKTKAMESPPFVTAFLAFAYGAAGDREAAMIELAELKRISRDGKDTAVQPGAGVPRSWRPLRCARGEHGGQQIVVRKLAQRRGVEAVHGFVP